MGRLSQERVGLLSINAGGEASTTATSERVTRWWIVAVFCCLSLLQAITWNLFAPVQSTVLALYGWSNNQIAWLANTANIGMLVSLPFSAVLVEAAGARLPTVACAAMMVACTVIRLVPQFTSGLPEATTFWLNVISMAFNGLAAAWLNFAGPVLSELWFAEGGRATVTSIVTVAPYTGVALGFILGPLFVPVAGNHTRHNQSNGTAAGGGNHSGGGGGGGGAVVGEHQLNQMLLVHAVCAVALFAAILLYFPAKPKVPPSRSAAKRQASKELDGKGGQTTASESVRALAWAICGCGERRVRSLALISMVFALPLGVYSGWGAVLSINLKEVGNMTAKEAGWVGCLMTLLGCFGGVLVGALNDRFAGQIKTWIVLSWAVASVGFILFGLRVLGYWTLPSEAADRVSIYALAIIGGFFINAPLPLFYELAVEETYPKIEAGTAGGVLSIQITIVQIVFLAVSFIPGQSSESSSAWMNWAMMLVTPVFTLPLLLLRVNYNRRKVDNPEMKVAWLDRRGF